MPPANRRSKLVSSEQPTHKSRKSTPPKDLKFGGRRTSGALPRCSEYQGVRVTVGLARAAEDTEIVRTTVERLNNPISQVDWVISTATGGPKIVDLLAEGTSLRLTQSSDFAAYLARHQYNIQELIEGMRQLIAQKS